MKEIPPAPEKNSTLLGTGMKTSWCFQRRLCSKTESASQRPAWLLLFTVSPKVGHVGTDSAGERVCEKKNSTAVGLRLVLTATLQATFRECCSRGKVNANLSFNRWLSCGGGREGGAPSQGRLTKLTSQVTLHAGCRFLICSTV